MTKNFTEREKEILSRVVAAGEEVVAVGKQHRLSKLIAPSIALSTNKKLIIFKRDAFGIRTDTHFIPYESIVSFRVVHGFLFSSIKLRLLGAVKPGEHAIADAEEDETEIRGLRKSMAKALAATLSENIVKSRGRTVEQHETVIRHSAPVINIFFTSAAGQRSIVPGMYLPSGFGYSAYETRAWHNHEAAGSGADGAFEEGHAYTAEARKAEGPEVEAAYALESRKDGEAATAQRAIEINEVVRRRNEQADMQAQANNAADAAAPAGKSVSGAAPNSAMSRNAASHVLESVGFIKSLLLGKPGADSNAAMYPKDDFIEELERKKLSED
ncbi:MAG: PH domain-containing protein [Candidatus Micrarchaeaceae archaeon]